MDITEEIGQVEATYNKNTKTFYAKFVPNIQTTYRAEGLVIDPTVPSEEAVSEQIKSTVAKWFSKVSEIELSDKFSNEFKIETVNCIKYSSGELKSARFKVSLRGV